jgi:FcoT-like thioesterase domain
MSLATQNSEVCSLDPKFLARILAPYHGTRTDYLRSASVRSSGITSADSSAPLFAVSGEFSIPTSCYIQDTGHFNAVEFLICYNQLAYSTFGYMFSSGAFRSAAPTRIPPACRDLLAKVSLEEFFTQQLSSMVILKCTTRFRNMIDAKHFFGTFSVERISHHKGSFFTETRCVFTDPSNGRAEGEVLLGYLADPSKITKSHAKESSQEARAHG